jgi:hypothetical protein
MTQLQHVAREALLLSSLSLPVALLLYPLLVYGNLAFNGLAEAAMVFFWHCAGVLAHIALASLPVSSCPCCQSCAGIVAELAFTGPDNVVLVFAGIALASSPTLCWGHCQHRAVVVVAGVASASLPLARGHLCSHCTPLAVVFTLLLSSQYLASLPYPVLLMPVLRLLSPDALAAMHTPFCHNVVIGASHGGYRRLGHGHPPGDSRVCRLELFLRLGDHCCPNCSC